MAHFAQKPVASPTPPVEGYGPTKVFEVRLPVTVTADTKKKELIAGLARAIFRFSEDGVQQENLFLG